MRPMKLAVSLLLALALLVPATAGAAGRAPHGTLTVALSSLASETLDPALGGHIVKFYLDQIFDYLVGVTPDGRLSHDTGVADRWESSSDHQRWTFHLRPGIRFHNGDPLTSADVKFSIERAISNRSTTGYAGPLRRLIKDIETPTPDRVVIVTKEPTLIIPAYLSRGLSSEGMILPKRYIQEKGDDYFATHPVGSGPYRFVEQVPGSHLTLEAVKSNWRIGTPRYEKLVFKLVPEESTRIAMLRNGTADIIDVSRDRVKEVRQAGFPIHVRKDDALVEFWWIAPIARTPLKDKRVREALNLAINRQELADTIFDGMARPASVPWGLSWAFSEVGFKATPDLQYGYDPARAKKLLADAGFPHGFSLAVYAYDLPGFPEGRSFAEAIAGFWEKIGLQVRLVPLDYPAFRKKWIDHSEPGSLGYYNLGNGNWIRTFALIDKYENPSSKTSVIADPELHRMIQGVSGAASQAKADALMRQIFTRLRTEDWGIAPVFVHTPYATSKALARWDPGSVMYDLNIDQLVSQK